MATTAMDYENANGDRFEDDGPRYDRDRSASPRRDDGHDSSRRRSHSPVGNERSAPKNDDGGRDDDGAINPGSNLFVTGIHPKLTEAEVTRLFEKYGDVEKCQIMRDPHSKESRGFGFVKMVTSDMADAAKDGLQGEVIEGRTLSIEKARRARPRTPTPGKYFGPPKRGPRPGEGGGGRFGDRFDNRRRGGFGGGGGDDSYRYRGYREDRGYDRNYERGGGGGGGYRDDRGYDRDYDRGGFRDDRGGGGGGGGYDRDYDRGAPRDDRGYERGGYREERGGGGGGGGYDRRDRDDGYTGGGGGGGGGRYGNREERGGGGGGRYGNREDRGGGGGGGYDRDARPRDGPPAGGYGDSAA